PFEVELYRKFAIPFACLVFVLLGTPIGIKIKRGGRGASFALSLAFALLYYLLIVAGEALGNRGQLHPALAMWTPNFLLGTVGAFLFRAEEKGRVPMVDVRCWMSNVGWWKARDTSKIRPLTPSPRPLKVRQRTGLVVLADPAWKLLVILVKGKELKFHVERKAAVKLFDLERGRKVTVKYVEQGGRLVAKAIVVPQGRKALGVRGKTKVP
ncbi:MAG: LptF/LptG family permease, partial [Candidatus Methylomirabilales bacterium]